MTDPSATTFSSVYPTHGLDVTDQTDMRAGLTLAIVQQEDGSPFLTEDNLLIFEESP
jgi:hypothetical protein